MNRRAALTIALLASGTLLGPSSLVRHRQASAATYGKLPLSFEPNRGQSGRGTDFVARGDGYSIALAQGAVKLRVPDGSVDLSFPGSHSSAPAEALDPRPGRVNYFIGNDPAKWLTNLPTYAKVRYRDLYTGVDLVLYGNQRQLEYDLIAQPGADVGEIALRVDGAERLDLDAGGELMITLPGGPAIRQRRPDMYQIAGGQRRSIEGGYRLTGEKTVAFWTGAYDRGLALTIDPVVVYTISFGGSGVYGDAPNAVAVDAFGNTFVAGSAASLDFPVSRNAVQLSRRNAYCANAFVAKIDPNGTTLEYATYLGGNNQHCWELNFEAAVGIAVDGAGNAYVTGATDSTDFPTANAFQARMQDDIGDGMDAFVTKLNPTGSALIYSTYLGGRDSRSQGNGIAVDSLGNAYVAGATEAQQFPATMMGSPGTRKVGFVTKFSATGSVVYSTAFPFRISAIAVDQVGQALIGGATDSPSTFPVVNGSTAGCFFPFPGACAVGFLARLSASGSQFIYSTLLGGEAEPRGVGTGVSSIAVDAVGNVYVAGSTSSSSLRTKNAVRPTFSGGLNDAFAASFAPDGALRYATYLGGSGDESRRTPIAVDLTGSAFIAGLTTSTDFPVARAIFGSNPAGPVFANAGRDAAWAVAGKGLTSSVIALVVDPFTPGVLYAGTHVDGVFKTTNAGQTWSAVNKGIGPGELGIRSLAVDPRTPETLYAGTSGGEVYKSVDGGGRWEQLFHAGGFVDVLAVDPVAPNVVYAGGESGLYTTIDGGRTWTKTRNPGVHAVAVDGTSQGIVYVLMGGNYYATVPSSLYKSSNRGSSWTAVNLPPIYPGAWRTALAVDPSAPQTLYVGWFDPYQKDSSGLLKSVDAGITWTRVFDRGVTSLVFAPRRQELYLSIVPRQAAEPCVWRSRDNGDTWNPAIVGLYAGTSTCEVNALAVDPIKSPAIYAGANLHQVVHLTRLNADGSLSYSTYLPVTPPDSAFFEFALAADVNGNAYLAGPTAIIQPGGYSSRALVMKVAPWPATTPCRSLDSDEQHCVSPPRDILPRSIDRR